MTQLTMDAPAAAPAPTGDADDEAIRPFRAHVPEPEVAEMRRRLAMTRWPDRETVADASQGARLADLQELVRYWATEYDWRRGEAKLNAHPQFITRIDGVDFHFFHVRSRHPDAMPLVVAHGWPGSVVEQLKLIEPLTDPTRFGGRAEDAFHVVIPSLPGYGFSSRPTETGWGVERTGRAFDALMKRLGYGRYVAQGGDWGAGVVEAMGRQAPPGLLGIHTNLPAGLTPEVEAALGAAVGGDESGLASFPEGEREAIRDFAIYLRGGGLSYLVMQGARPQAVGYGLTDSPAGLAGWMLVHGGFAKWTYGRDPEQTPTRDEVLDNFSLHWLTNTVASGARFYWEGRQGSLLSATAQRSAEIRVPVAVTLFPDEIVRVQEAWARRAFPTLSYFHEADRGGHFAAWEEPELFSAELRAAFAPLRQRGA
ncbi:MAG TPA: epoxide hydrolase [Longimicrobiaceae bacterium]|jgi:pimeloyl-ACP methyl ester carboxylesterase